MEINSPMKEPKRKDSAKSMHASDLKRGSAGSAINDGDCSPRVNKKFIENWRHACHATKDRTKELLKKWRTLPEPGYEADPSETASEDESKGWSEHVWTTWVKRCPSGDGSQDVTSNVIDLTPVQREKFTLFFVNLLDMDCDEVISLCDFETLFEKFRHFADWSKNSPEYHRLLEVQRGFIEYFLLPEESIDTTHASYEVLMKAVRTEQLELDEWLLKWSQMLSTTRNFLELPLWLQIFPQILFQVINKSGTGFISRTELATFYTSVVGLSEPHVSQSIKKVFKILTSNEQHKLDAHVYRLSFANFILGRYPNGPGQYLLHPLAKSKEMFPIDYKAMSCAHRDLEQYSPEVKTNRRSVIV